MASGGLREQQRHRCAGPGSAPPMSQVRQPVGCLVEFAERSAVSRHTSRPPHRIAGDLRAEQLQAPSPGVGLVQYAAVAPVVQPGPLGVIEQIHRGQPARCGSAVESGQHPFQPADQASHACRVEDVGAVFDGHVETVVVTVGVPAGSPSENARSIQAVSVSTCQRCTCRITQRQSGGVTGLPREVLPAQQHLDQRVPGRGCSAGLSRSTSTSNGTS